MKKDSNLIHIRNILKPMIKITSFFGLSLVAAILVGSIALTPNAYAGDPSPFPTVNPPSINTSLFQGELGQFPTTINPNNSDGIIGVFDDLNSQADCTNSGFFANISITPVNVGPTLFDWRWDIQPYINAVPAEYVCTADWSLQYTDQAGNTFTQSALQEIRVTVLSSTIDVDIDIKPGSDPNSINTRSMGVVPVAILGSESFDVTNIDVSTLVFGPAGAAPAHDLSNPNTYSDHLQDVNDDGFLDLVSHYPQKETGIVCGDTEATISAELFDGTPIEGTDSVNPKGC